VTRSIINLLSICPMRKSQGSTFF